jgi:hypothetical protein
MDPRAMLLCTDHIEEYIYMHPGHRVVNKLALKNNEIKAVFLDKDSPAWDLIEILGYKTKHLLSAWAYEYFWDELIIHNTAKSVNDVLGNSKEHAIVTSALMTVELC